MLPGSLKLLSSPLEPLRDIIREARERVEKAGSDVRSLADEIRGFATPERQTAATDTESQKEAPPVQKTTTAITGEYEAPGSQESVATACVACAVGHFSTSSGLIKEALRFKGEGMASYEVLDRIAGALEEQNALEREDLTQEKIQNLPDWEKPIAYEALEQSRQLRHKLETVQSIEELEQLAADTRKYYLKLSRQWYRGRFGHLGEAKADAIAQRVGGA